jgi:Na+/H+ antiporter NhaC
MKYDLMQFTLFLVVFVWFLARRKHWRYPERTVVYVLWIVYCALSLAEDISDNNAGWAALSAGVLALLTWWLIEDLAGRWDARRIVRRHVPTRGESFEFIGWDNELRISKGLPPRGVDEPPEEGDL